MESGERITEYLKILVERGFHSTADCLRRFLLEKLEMKKAAEKGSDPKLQKTTQMAIEAVKGFQICRDTFNSDVVFQLNYLGNTHTFFILIFWDRIHEKRDGGP